MSRKLFITLLSTLYIRFCVGISSYWFPPCNQPLSETIRVNIGENATLSVTLVERYSDGHGRHVNEYFTWINGRGAAICRSVNGRCKSDSNRSFQMKVTQQILQGYLYSYLDYTFEMTIVQSDFSDNGVYTLQSSHENPCIILRLDVIVRDTLPSCTTHLKISREDMRLSCKWILMENDDMMQLLSKNDTVQSLEGNEIIAGTAIGDMSWNTAAAVISTSFAIRDSFDKKGTPDTCLVSNAQLEFENRCEFLIFMSPKMNEINRYGEDTAFTCCTESDKVPSLWWYNKNTATTTQAPGQNFTVNLDTSTQNRADSTTFVIFFICGEGNDELTLFRTGELVLNLEHDRVVLSGRIEPDSSGSDELKGGKTCAHSYSISINANPLESEYSTITDGSTLNTEVLNDLTTTSQGTSTYTTNTTHRQHLSSPTHDTHADASIGYEIWIPILLIGTISILLNAVVCVNKCSNILRSRKLCWNNPKTASELSIKTGRDTSLSMNITGSQNARYHDDGNTEHRQGYTLRTNGYEKGQDDVLYMSAETVNYQDLTQCGEQERKVPVYSTEANASARAVDIYHEYEAAIGILRPDFPESSLHVKQILPHRGKTSFGTYGTNNTPTETYEGNDAFLGGDRRLSNEAMSCKTQGGQQDCKVSVFKTESNTSACPVNIHHEYESSISILRPNISESLLHDNQFLPS